MSGPLPSASEYSGGQVSTEQAQELDALQVEFLNLVARVDRICDQVPPSTAISILYHFSSTALAFARRAGERSNKSLAQLLPPSLPDVRGLAALENPAPPEAPRPPVN